MLHIIHTKEVGGVGWDGLDVGYSNSSDNKDFFEILTQIISGK